MTDKITKTITGFETDVLPYIMANLAQGFENIDYDAATQTITATGVEHFWSVISLPSTAVVTPV